MNKLADLHLYFENIFFDKEFDDQWDSYINMYPTKHSALLKRIVYGSCHSLITNNVSEGQLKEHFFDIKFPEFSFSYSVSLKFMQRKRYLVVDDLSPQLRLHPIYILIPKTVFAIEDLVQARLVAFTYKVYQDLMSTDYFEWDHSHNDIVIDSFEIRYDKIYPSIST